MMAKYLKNIVPGALITLTLAAVLIRSFNNNHFKADANKYAQPSYNNAVIITREQAALIKGEKLIIYTGGSNEADGYAGALEGKIIHADPVSILNGENRKEIMKHKGIVLVVSEEPSMASAIWMILSQMGRKDIFVISGNRDPEVFKYEFRPDTLTRPEF